MKDGGTNIDKTITLLAVILFILGLYITSFSFGEFLEIPYSPKIFSSKSNSFGSDSCFEALDKLDGNKVSFRDINKVRSSCSGISKAEAYGYAESQGLQSGICEEPLADITGDGIVDFADVLFILADWGCTDCGDIDGDGVLGFGDILVILANWGCEFSGELEECEDGIDNDNDGWTDLEDYGCIVDSVEDVTGSTECSNQIDDADPEDTLADGNDPDCVDWTDNAESNLLPDLKISRIQLWISPPDYKLIRVNASNIGEAPSPETTIAAEWEFRNESGDPVGEHGFYNVSVPALGAGESTGYYFTEEIFEPRCGSVFIWGRIDPYNEIVESNENNNFRGSPQNLAC
jgi:hypothetical protein